MQLGVIGGIPRTLSLNNCQQCVGIGLHVTHQFRLEQHRPQPLETPLVCAGIGRINRSGALGIPGRTKRVNNSDCCFGRFCANRPWCVGFIERKLFGGITIEVEVTIEVEHLGTLRANRQW